jgi:phospholipid transport system substrate-binding protein
MEGKTSAQACSAPWERTWGGRLALGLVVAIALLRPGYCETPLAHVQATIGAVVAILENTALQGADNDAERRQRVRHIIFESFAFPEMAKEVLGGYWHKLTAAQREEFTALFRNLFERSYNRLVLRFLGERRTLYGDESVDQGRAVVQTTLVSKQEARLPVDYRLIRDGERWAIYDVAIEGVSLTMNYRAQFNKILRSSSYETLVQRIRTKLEEEP